MYKIIGHFKSWRRIPSQTLFVRNFGQPAAQTHPHLMSEGEVTPGLTKSEFEKRRCNLVKLATQAYTGVKSVKDHLFIFPSASVLYMTNDIPYIFRQNTDFLYFSGFQEPDSFLLIEADKESLTTGKHKSSLFVPPKDPQKELWDGPRSGIEGALLLTGVDAAFNSGDFEKYLKCYNDEHENFILWYQHNTPVHADLHNRVINQLANKQRYKTVENTTGLAHTLRLVKSHAEVELMQKSVDIASKAFKEVMKFSQPRMNEAQLWAKMDFECRMLGAEFLAYPPVVAGGSRANIIHYITNNQEIQDGELVLMDAGCEFHGYVSDLTRTWPVSGKFTDNQKRVYNALLRVQEFCIEQCTTGISLDELFHNMLLLLTDELCSLGIIPLDSSLDHKLQLTRKYCPHHVSHYLGMDVHDTGLVSRRIKLKPGMIVTVEPGVYFPEHDYSVGPEFRGMGIRIEDNILITANGPVNLSASCPKTVEEIENLIAESR